MKQGLEVSSTNSRIERSPSSDGGETSDEAFSKLLEEAASGLRRRVRGQVGSAEAADDAVQETFLRVLRYRDIKDVGAIRALLFRIAASVIVDSYRRMKAQRADDHCSLDGMELASTMPTPERVMAGREDLALVKQAIRNLPPRCRQVFLLHRFDGLSYRQIAERLGTSPRTVENQIARALAVCRQAIGENRGGTFK